MGKAPASPHSQWWTLHGEVLIEVLRRAHEGEDPNVLYLELVANSQIEDYRGPDPCQQ